MSRGGNFAAVKKPRKYAGLSFWRRDALTLVVAMLAFVTGLDGDFGMMFLALIRHLTADRAAGFDAALAILLRMTLTAVALADIARHVALRLLFHLSFRGLFSLRHDKAPAGSATAAIFGMISLVKKTLREWPGSQRLVRFRAISC
jgi:hypothetical protein